jgi:hypothetical protein
LFIDSPEGALEPRKRIGGANMVNKFGGGEGVGLHFSNEIDLKMNFSACFLLLVNKKMRLFVLIN